MRSKDSVSKNKMTAHVCLYQYAPPKKQLAVFQRKLMMGSHGDSTVKVKTKINFKVTRFKMFQ